MKSPLLGIFFLLLVGSLSAQTETLFNRARVVGAFGGPISEFGINNKLNTATGGGFGLVINNFFIGGYGVASVDYEELFNNGEVNVLNMSHGGFWLGSTFQPYRLLHLYGSARLGWGGVDIDLNDNTRYRDVDKIFVITPEVGVELNITKWMRLAGTVGYRYTTGLDESIGYQDEDFSGLMAGVTLRFGWFGRGK